MIGRVFRGCRAGGLLRYLYGPGRCNEHTDPHLVASWDGQHCALEPILGPGGGHDVRRLTALLEQPLGYADPAPERPVWHCALRTAPGDRRLTDAEWADVAAEVLDRTGIAPRGDDGACRWVAVRHAEDHIHVLAVLARQDGAGVRLWRDFPKLRAACREVEARYGLTETPPADGSVPPRPTRAEHEKAARRIARAPTGPGRRRGPDGGRGQPSRPPRTAREQLRIAVRRAAVAATDYPDFAARLHGGGVLLHERRGERGELTGYAVALGTDLAGNGAPVFFGGGKLAADLSLPRLQARWANAPSSDVRHRPHVARHASREVPRPGDLFATATSATHELTRDVTAGKAPDAASAAADAIATISQLTTGEVRRRLSAAADAQDESIVRRGVLRPPTRTPHGFQLTTACRTLAIAGVLTEDAEGLAHLLLALAALNAAIAASRQSRVIGHTADAALQSSLELRAASRALLATTTDQGHDGPAWPRREAARDGSSPPPRLAHRQGRYPAPTGQGQRRQQR